MSTQKDYVDYKYAGDIGTDTTSSIQPIVAGEAVTQNALRRPSENLRTRTEIVRSTMQDLLYYRNRQQYVVELAGTGLLSWAGTIALFGTGVLNNSTQLTLRPMLTARINTKGLLAIGTTTVNAVSYEVQPTAYETDGMNEITVEHRDVTGTVAVTCVISDGPVKRILVVFDSANIAHNSTVTTAAVNVAIGLDTLLNGKLLAVNDGAPGTAILTIGETYIDVRTHGVGTAGNATIDVEEHTLAAGAIGVFTAANPLAEGDLLAIRYDYVIEPLGGDPNDPKGGVPGGRAESNASRLNTSVTANLFIAQDQPEWLPGAIPLCKIVNNVARWVDGSNVAMNFPAVPGAALGTNINTASFQGPPTLVVGGGLLSTDDTLQEALDSTDDRLGSLRTNTWTLTDGVASTGGHFDSAGAILSAIPATVGGGHLYARRGTYLGPPAGALALGNLLIEGERADNTIWNFATAGSLLGGMLRARSVRFQRTAGVFTQIDGAELEDCAFDTGLFVFNTASHVSMTRCTMDPVAQAVLPSGLTCTALRMSIVDCDFTGPDALAVSGSLLSLVNTARFEARNTTFTLVGANPLLPPSFFAYAANSVLRFVGCRIENNSDSYLLDLTNTISGTNVNILFEDCTFVNNTGARLVRLKQGNGVNVTFTRCAFRPNNTNVPTSSMIRTLPLSGGSVTFNDCYVEIAQAVTGAVATFALVELGVDAANPFLSSGPVHVNGLQVTYLSSATGLHSAQTVHYKQDPTYALPSAVGRRITVDFAGKRSIAGTVAAATFGNVPVQVLRLLNVDYPDTGSQSILSMNGCDTDDVQLAAIAVPAAASFPADAVLFTLSPYGGRLSNARIPRFRAVGASVSFAGSGVSSLLPLDCVEILSVVNGDTAINADLYFSYTRANRLRTARINGVLNAGSFFAGLFSIFNKCDLFYDDGRTTILDLSTVTDIELTECQLAIDNVTANAILGNTAAPAATGHIVTNNRLYNLAAFVPTLPGPAPVTSVVANNVFQANVTL